MAMATTTTTTTGSDLNELMQKGLFPRLEQLDGLLAEMEEMLDSYRDLKGQIRLLRMKRQQGQEQMETMIDIGGDVYVKALIPDMEYIYVSIGLQYHAQLTLDEADKVADERIEYFEERIRKISKDRATVNVHATVVRHHLQNLFSS